MTTAERHMVTIETERTGRIELTPQEFDMLLASASVGLEGAPFEGEESRVADDLFKKVERAAKLHGGS